MKSKSKTDPTHIAKEKIHQAPDLTSGSVVYENIDFSDRNVKFCGKSFPDGCKFINCIFPEGTSFEDASFGSEESKTRTTVRFSSCTFKGDRTSFCNSKFINCNIDFSENRFLSSTVDFSLSELSGGAFTFTGNKICNGQLLFMHAVFDAFELGMTLKRLTIGLGADFTGVTIKSKVLEMDDIEFGEGELLFEQLTIHADKVIINKFIIREYLFKISLKKNECNTISITNSKIGGRFVFSSTHGLSGSLFCNRIDFNGGVSIALKGVEINSLISLKDCIIDRELDIRGTFTRTPDLTGTYIKNHISMNNFRVQPIKKKFLIIFNKHHFPDDCEWERLGKIKEIYESNKDHQNTIKFHVLEMKARRHHQVRGLQLIPDYLFSAFSDYGLSIKRPLLWLLLIFTSIFLFTFITSYNPSLEYDNGIIFKSLLISLTSIFSFIPESREIRSDLINAVYLPCQEANCLVLNPIFSKCNMEVINLIFLVSSLISSLLIFLIVLGFRNRFKI
ncbi:hypothetical protein [Vibrio rhodolitus]|uniref:hypothetical protein n=1 Tax=Vibrio rhodolitus TaxID=2231649 RepID=UPI000E0C8487|nr:hypothetical protein [Vibrio rhodolitus]